MSSTTAVSPSWRSERSRARLRAAIALAATVGGYVLVWCMDLWSHGDHRTLCLFKALTGIACPGCGMGRATLALLHGDVQASLAFHALAVPFNMLVAGGVIALLIDLVRGTDRVWRTLRAPWPAWSRVAVLSLIALSWALNILRGV